MTNVLITGGNGIVGRHFKRHLQESQETYHCHNFGGDIRSKDDIRTFSRQAGEADIVVNLAAIVEVTRVQEKPDEAYAVNAGGVLNLLQVLMESGQKPYFFQCSTSHVYAPSSNPISEAGLIEPHSVYGRTKLMAELITQDVCSANAMPFCIGRLFSIHDPQQTGSYLRPSMERRLREADIKAPFELTGANSVRDFLSADEAAKHIARIVCRKPQGVMNIASGRGMKVREFVQSLCPYKLDIVHKGDTNALVADITRLKAELGNDPTWI